MTMTMTRMMKRAALGLVMVAGLAQGCLVFGQDDVKQGYTECGDFFADIGDHIYCQPGTYCADSTFSECKMGCTSNENCAEDQRCVKADGTQLGACQATIKRPATEPRNGATSGSARDGETRCGDGDRMRTCPANQYCSNAYFGLCDAGCVSDANCASEQLCVKAAGRNNGTCQRGDRNAANNASSMTETSQEDPFDEFDDGL